MLGLTIAPKEDTRSAINFYLSDPSIGSEEAEAMKQAYEESCRRLESSGRKFSTPVVATLIDNFAKDGEHNTTRLIQAVLNALSFNK